MSGEPRLVVGMQPVREAIRAHRERVVRVVVDDRDQGRLDALARYAVDNGVPIVDRKPGAELDRLSGGAQHQGALAFAPALTLVDASAVLSRAELVGVALDGIQDPQNFGAVIRSAVGIAGAVVLWGENRSAPLTPATFRASAGAIEHAELCRVASLAGTLASAREQGVQVVGLDAQGERMLCDVDLVQPTLLVIGSEGEGMGRATRRACSVHAKLLPMSRLDSLNASVAAGIALYELITQRLRAPTTQART